MTSLAATSTAKSCATLSSLSKGRFMLGVGVGWCREQYEALNMLWDHRGDRHEEGIEALRTQWREDEPSYKGRYLQFPTFVIPIQAARRVGPNRHRRNLGPGGTKGRPDRRRLLSRHLPDRMGL